MLLGESTGRKLSLHRKRKWRKFRDLLGPPEEGNMLGGRRFKAWQPSELVFLWTSELVYIHKQIVTKKAIRLMGS